MRSTHLTLFLLFSLFGGAQLLSGQSEPQNRVIVLTDIEADPDDTQSLIRLLLYSNQLEIKGLIATTSCWMKAEINPASIERVVEAYGKVRNNLLLHEDGFPEEKELTDMIKSGLPKYGMEGVGAEMDSEGSDWILKVLEEEDDRPLWVSVWGGTNTLAQMLYKIRSTKSEEEVNRLVSKLRVYTISDQDDSGIWIRNNFPDLFYIVSPGDDYGSATWTGINSFIKGNDNSEISNDWLAQNIQQGHGPLGAIYPDVSWGVEGDTPAFLSLIPNGLNAPEHPNYGGWGGRYEQLQPVFAKQKNSAKSGVPWSAETRKIWTDAEESYKPYADRQYGRAIKQDTAAFSGNKVSLWRWRDDFQNDFAARMDWCTQTYAEANHPPVPRLSHPEEITLKSGEDFTLDAFDSGDPDGDNISLLWFPYSEAGSYHGELNLAQPENAPRFRGTAPTVQQTETFHIILRVTDKGKPSLSRYKRIIITVLPK